MVGRNFLQGDYRRCAFFLRKFAARRERTTWYQFREIGRSTRDRMQLLSFFVKRRNGFLQRLIIRMFRLVKNLRGGGAFYDSPRVHDQHAIAKTRNNTEDRKSTRLNSS